MVVSITISYIFCALVSCLPFLYQGDWNCWFYCAAKGLFCGVEMSSDFGTKVFLVAAVNDLFPALWSYYSFSAVSIVCAAAARTPL